MANSILDLTAKGMTVMASLARTATPDTVQFNNYAGYRDAWIMIDVTAVTSTPSTIFKVETINPVDGTVFSTVIASAAVASVSKVLLRIGPAVTAAANVAVNDRLPSVFRVTATHGNANSMTYSVGIMVA